TFGTMRHNSAEDRMLPLFGRSTSRDAVIAIRPEKMHMTLPEGWTDDLRIPLPRGRTVAEVVEFVLQAVLGGTADADIEQLLVAEFLLSPDDASLARDRTLGGLVRAATGNLQNCPAQDKDPVAWESFQRGSRDPSLIARIYPQYASSN